MVLKIVPPPNGSDGSPMPATIEAPGRKAKTELHVVSRRPWPDWALAIVYRAFHLVFVRLLLCKLEIRLPDRTLTVAQKKPPTAVEAREAFDPYYFRSVN